MSYPHISPAPDWGEIFKRHPDLQPPGYLEAIKSFEENPYVKPKVKEKEEKKKKKKVSKLGRGQTQ